MTNYCMHCGEASTLELTDVEIKAFGERGGNIQHVAMRGIRRCTNCDATYESSLEGTINWATETKITYIGYSEDEDDE